MYDLELDNLKEQLKLKKPRRILVHLPCGLKPNSMEIKKAIEEVSDAKIVFWSGSNYGACDVPFFTQKLGVDLIITFGHSEWVYQ
ncbi:hypothetical protein HOC99_04860 [Candidatus Woesearchaeota archaeon]|jgi:diphthamide biosynthesis enzyme Dph1/Dph2-like protein|nr:hypothetical protein [Candidatus Woesearchaeota archaeon]MBT4387233.1 hypothetical protein [Candidatus Woesearchaeota archaeon]MBT4596234.1 hypothetical protein [Candidatus Woesearchaeota archaeon]MBT5741543.1 hypothetical protein [Candidatus Woesearchaeota archaeon]MBT7296209.1 hypothetical protein [Candidatus Woesearchaeota archaeon]